MRDLIKLTCQTCKRDNYVTSKNKRTQTEKFEIKKFCNACRSAPAVRIRMSTTIPAITQA